jgi:hypothetical protein
LREWFRAYCGSRTTGKHGIVQDLLERATRSVRRVHEKAMQIGIERQGCSHGIKSSHSKTSWCHLSVSGRKVMVFFPLAHHDMSSRAVVKIPGDLIPERVK